MADVIVIAGKGGTGKTTVSSLLTLTLAKRKSGSVLAVDADPNSNLADALGLKPCATVADIIDEVAKNPHIVPQNMGKDNFIEYKIHSDITESDGFDLLVMGRPEGPGCYCYINNVLRNCMAKLVADYRFVVIDNEAGMEHFSRKTTRACQELIVVSDETEVGLKSARKIFDLIEELGIPARRKFLVVNRVREKKDFRNLKAEFGVEKIFSIPMDQEILRLSSEGGTLAELSADSLVLSAIKELGDEICPRN